MLCTESLIYLPFSLLPPSLPPMYMYKGIVYIHVYIVLQCVYMCVGMCT